MTKYVLTGDVVRPGRVIVEADSREEAIKRIEADEANFDEVLETDNHDTLALFQWNGDSDSIEEWE